MITISKLGWVHLAHRTSHKFFKNLRCAAHRTTTEKSPFSLARRGPESAATGWRGGRRTIKNSYFIICKSKIQMAAGSSSDQPLLVSSESSAYPDFKAYHRLAPDDRLPSKKNHIEQNFFILKRTKRNNRTEHIECQCAFCSISFKSFNSTQMRVHLTGENCIANRNSVGGSKFSKTEGLVRDRHSF